MTLRLGWTVRTVVVLVVGMALSHLAVQSAGLVTRTDGVGGFFPQGDILGIVTMPTWLCAILLFLSTGLMWMIGMTSRRAADPLATYWAVAGSVVLAGAMGEASAIPSLAGQLVRATVGAFGTWGGSLLFGALATGLIVLFAPVYQNFVRRMPLGTRHNLAQSGVFLAIGTTFLAMMGTPSASRLFSTEDVTRTILWVTVIQGVKIAGALTLIDSLTGYLSHYYDDLSTPMDPWRRAAYALPTLDPEQPSPPRQIRAL